MNKNYHRETTVYVDVQHDNDKPITQHHCKLTTYTNKWPMYAMTASDMNLKKGGYYWMAYLAWLPF
jgi:hypothetical protein